MKPANVMVTDEGRIKVLDFGLAKAPLDFRNRDDTRGPRSATEDGHIVGTPAYMSPEQAEGKKVDTRSDIFSLGIVFYEMLTGQRPFGGDSPTSMLASIVRDAPRPLSERQPAIPREVARLVHRCLAKNPVDRYQSAIDLRHDLEQAKQDIESGVAVPSHPTSPVVRRSPWMPVTLLAAVLGAVAATWLLTNRTEPAGVPRLQNAVQVTSTLDVESYPTWSPDGLRLAYQAGELGWFYVGNHDIWVAQIGGGEPQNLTKDSPANDRMPSWSPDGRDIAFFSNRSGEWGVYTIPAIGGQPHRVLPLPQKEGLNWSAPQWSMDGTSCTSR